MKIALPALILVIMAAVAVLLSTTEPLVWRNNDGASVHDAESAALIERAMSSQGGVALDRRTPVESQVRSRDADRRPGELTISGARILVIADGIAQTDVNPLIVEYRRRVRFEWGPDRQIAIGPEHEVELEVEPGEYEIRLNRGPASPRVIRARMGSPEVVRFSFEEAWVAEFMVVDELGRAIEGAELFARTFLAARSPQALVARTNSRGRCKVHMLGRADVVVFQAKQLNGRSDSRSGDPRSVTRLVMRHAPCQWLAEVRWRNGEALSPGQAVLRRVAQEEAASEDVVVASIEDGAASAEGLLAGNYLLTIVYRGETVLQSTLRLPADWNSVLQVPCVVTVVGKLVNASQEPVAGRLVAVQSHDSVYAMSGVDGAFVLTNAPVEALVFEVGDADVLDFTGAVPVDGVLDVGVVVLDDRRSVPGKVLGDCVGKDMMVHSLGVLSPVGEGGEFECELSTSGPTQVELCWCPSDGIGRLVIESNTVPVAASVVVFDATTYVAGSGDLTVVVSQSVELPQLLSLTHLLSGQVIRFKIESRSLEVSGLPRGRYRASISKDRASEFVLTPSHPRAQVAF